MGFDGLLVKEIFYSIQGETTLTGLPFIFIRLSGCNLRCTYCDTTYSFKGGERLRISEILNRIAGMPTRHVLLTGGEPLLQRQTPDLVRVLQEAGYLVSIETHGEVDISKVLTARIVMDIKLPDSGMYRQGYRRNLALLKPQDEIKFVISSEKDYTVAREICNQELFSQVPCEILFSAAIPSAMSIQMLAEKILKDGLSVRLQTQLHKWIWGVNCQGV